MPRPQPPQRLADQHSFLSRRAFRSFLAETCGNVHFGGLSRGGIVLDPFLGSGTTAAAAKSLDRRYIGIEINPEYCNLAKQRIGGESP